MVERILFRIALKNLGFDVFFTRILFRPMLFEEFHGAQTEIALAAACHNVAFHIKGEVTDLGFFAEFDLFIDRINIMFAPIGGRNLETVAVGNVKSADVAGSGAAFIFGPLVIVAASGVLGAARPEIPGAGHKEALFLQIQRKFDCALAVITHRKGIETDFAELPGFRQIARPMVVKAGNKLFGHGSRLYRNDFVADFPPRLHAAFPLEFVAELALGTGGQRGLEETFDPAALTIGVFLFLHPGDDLFAIHNFFAHFLTADQSDGFGQFKDQFIINFHLKTQTAFAVGQIVAARPDQTAGQPHGAIQNDGVVGQVAGFDFQTAPGKGIGVFIKFFALRTGDGKHRIFLIRRQIIVEFHGAVRKRFFHNFTGGVENNLYRGLALDIEFDLTFEFEFRQKRKLYSRNFIHKLQFSIFIGGHPVDFFQPRPRTVTFAVVVADDVELDIIFIKFTQRNSDFQSPEAFVFGGGDLSFALQVAPVPSAAFIQTGFQKAAASGVVKHILVYSIADDKEEFNGVITPDIGVFPGGGYIRQLSGIFLKCLDRHIQIFIIAHHPHFGLIGGVVKAFDVDKASQRQTLLIARIIELAVDLRRG